MMESYKSMIESEKAEVVATREEIVSDVAGAIGELAEPEVGVELTARGDLAGNRERLERMGFRYLPQVKQAVVTVYGVGFHGRLYCKPEQIDASDLDACIAAGVTFSVEF